MSAALMKAKRITEVNSPSIYITTTIYYELEQRMSFKTWSNWKTITCTLVSMFIVYIEKYIKLFTITSIIYGLNSTDRLRLRVPTESDASLDLNFELWFEQRLIERSGYTVFTARHYALRGLSYRKYVRPCVILSASHACRTVCSSFDLWSWFMNDVFTNHDVVAPWF